MPSKEEKRLKRNRIIQQFKEKSKERTTQYIHKWIEKSKFWRNNVVDFKEVDTFTFLCSCKDLNIESFRFNVEAHGKMHLFYFNTLLPYKYDTEVGLGKKKVGSIKVAWRFAPYEKPAQYSEERVKDLIGDSHLREQYDLISETLNNDEVLLKNIKKAPFVFSSPSGSIGSHQHMSMSIPLPMLIMQEVNGMHIRFTSFTRKKVGPDLLIVDILDSVVAHIKRANLPAI